MLINITDSAVAAIREAFADEGTSPDASYLRVGVRGGGCSGLAYDLTIDAEKREDDVEIEKDGVRLLVDVKSQLFLTGTTLDYTKGLSGRGFVFVNPNATGTCGCGESFSV